MSQTRQIRLVAIAALAAVQYGFLTEDVAAGQPFVLSFQSDKADELQRTVEYLTVTNQLAKVAEDQSGLNGEPDASNTPPPDPGAKPSAPPPENKKGAKLAECRVLQSCEHGEVNAVVQLPAAALKEAKALGLVCDDKTSVDYAKALQAAKQAAAA